LLLLGAVLARLEVRGAVFNCFFALLVACRLLLTTRPAVRLVFADFALVALCARAFPAGERFVAGFSRVAFGLAADLADARADDRGEIFFTLLATEVLMRKLPR
jgi:hypothetical protein